MTFADIARLIRHRGPLLRRDRWSRQRLLAHQARALVALRTFTYARSPFYRKFHAGLMDRPLEDLPVLTKAELMRNFDDVVTDRGIRLGDVEEHFTRTGGAERFAGRYTISASSGSSRNPCDASSRRGTLRPLRSECGGWRRSRAAPRAKPP